MPANEEGKEDEVRRDPTEARLPEFPSGKLDLEGLDLSAGAKLSFTFNEGLVVQIQPNGDCLQKIIESPAMPKSQTKGNQLFEDQMQLPNDVVEAQRIITFFGEVIRQLDDDNCIIYYPDGTITMSDKRRGLWYTISPKGVRRTRRIKDQVIFDDEQPVKSETKTDPETNAVLTTREDGLLIIDYADSTKYIIFPDGTEIVNKNRPDGEAGRMTIISKDGYVPVR